MLFAKQEGAEDQPPVLQSNASFGLAGENCLLRRAGHVRPVRPVMFGRVRIRVCGERAVFGGGFLIVRPGADVAAGGDQTSDSR